MSYYKKVFKPVMKEKIGAISGLVIKLIGDTPHGRLLRAALMGALAASSSYMKEDSQPVIESPPVVISPAQAQAPARSGL